MSRRKSHYGLTNSRIYKKRNRFYLFARDPVEHPRTGKVSKWHSLCLVSEGEAKAAQLASDILRQQATTHATGDFGAHLEAYRLAVLKRREKDRPREPARVKIFESGSKEVTRICNGIKSAFEDFNVEQVMGVDVARFVDQWQGQRAAQVYLSRMSDFFRWAVRRGLRADNPCQNIRVDKPEKRKRYITDTEWHAIRDALMVGADGRPTPSGPMVQCYVDLCFLLYQRTTEIRLLKWSQVDIDGSVIHFLPTKTERSSGLSVGVPISDAVKAVLERVRNIGKVRSLYVIHTLKGQPYTTHGIGDAWARACERAGVTDATMKDIRAKAATDAKKAGYSRSQIRIGLAHTDEAMTETYMRGRDVAKSEVVLALPVRKTA